MKKIVITLFYLSVFYVIILCPGCGGNAGNEQANGSNSLQGDITISGAFALYPLAVRWGEEFKKLHPDVRINISAGGAGKGMADALSGMVDLGMFSKEISPEEYEKGAWAVAVAKDAVLPTTCASNPALPELQRRGMTKQQLYDIFISGKITSWGQVLGNSMIDEVQVFTRSDACGAAEMWAKYLMNHHQEDLLGIGINGDPGLADALRKIPGSIGYNNTNYVYDVSTNKKYSGLEVIPIDVNENGQVDPEEMFYESLESVIQAVRDGRYPSPPARQLYFVSKGRPAEPAVVEFLKWVITDGQAFVPESGYVLLPDMLIQKELKKLQ